MSSRQQRFRNKSQVLQGKVTWGRSDTELASTGEVSLSQKPGRGWGGEWGKRAAISLPKQLAASERDNRGDAEDLIKRKVLERPHREETKSLLPARDPAVLLHHSADGISDRKNGKCSIDSRKPPTTNPASNSGSFTNSLFVWANPVTVTDSEILGRHLGRRHHNHPQLRLHRRERAGDFWRSGAVLTPPDSFPTLRQGLIVRTLGLYWVLTLLSRKICLWDFFFWPKELQWKYIL